METKLSIKINNKIYTTIIGKNILNKVSKYANFKNNILNIIIIDSKVYKNHKNYINKIFKNKNSKKIIFNSSEKSKSFESYYKIIKKIFYFKPDRKTKIIIIGGGVLGDLGGFIASTLLRGLDLILIPTTLLSQVDSSIGGKNGINFYSGKNLIGTFYQPKLVLIDISFLNTLSKRQIKSGYSEIVKHAVIKNKKYFGWLEKNYNKVLNLDKKYILMAIIESIKIKSSIVMKDEKENLISKNSRALLNFGHTIGHALEASNKYKNNLTHGEAISLGMVCALKISNKLKYISNKKIDKIIRHLKNAKLPTNIENINLNNLKRFIIQDKKNFSNKINFIVLKDIGNSSIEKNIPFAKLNKFYLK